MNIGFEISPLITASGTFGDKSGVYRYRYGLLKSFIELTAKRNKKAGKEKNRNSKIKIILFSFNRDCLRYPFNPEIAHLLNYEHVIFLNKTPKYNNLEIPPDTLDGLPPVKIVLKIINKMTNAKGTFYYIANAIRYRRYINFLQNTLKHYKVSVVYHSETGFYPLKGFKQIITIYDLTTTLMPQFHRSETIDLQQRKMRFTKRHCDAVVCISKSTKNDLLREIPIFKNKKILVCYPGLDTAFHEKISPQKKRRGLKEINTLVTNEYKLQPLKYKHYLFYWGTFEPRKNLSYLVRAFTDLQQTKSIPLDFKLVMAGGNGWGNTKTLIANFVNENFPIRAKRNILTLKYLSDEYIKHLISNAYAIVYPSLYEGFGLPVLESMALGTPVICSHNSSLPEVGGGDSVLYLNAWNFKDVKQKITYLIKHPNTAKQLSEKGLNQVKKFNWRSSGKKLLKFLETL